MFTKLGSRFARLFLSVLILSGLLLAAASPASAASPSFKIQSVQPNYSVTIHTSDFPANINFTVRMDRMGNNAVNGYVVGTTNSGGGGNFDATYLIPSALYGVSPIAIRLESAEGYYAYNYFTNATYNTSYPPATTGKVGSLVFSNIVSNASVTVEGVGLRPNTTFLVRVGPYYNFFYYYAVMPNVTSDANGYVKFNVTLPASAFNSEWVTVRLDGSGTYAYNAYKNLPYAAPLPPAPVPVTGAALACQVVSVTPTTTLAPYTDFDVVWTVKNTGTKAWDGNSVDYKFVSGTAMQKYNAYYDLHKNVNPGETAQILVDMKAPGAVGYYNTTWALVQGGTTICSMPFYLTVK